MRKFWIATLVLTALFFLPGPCRAQYEYDNEEMRTFDGQATNVDVINSTLTVSGTMNITFPVSSDTKFTKDIYDIKLSDIKAGDYVSVSYIRYPSSSRKPLKTLSVTIAYDKGK